MSQPGRRAQGPGRLLSGEASLCLSGGQVEDG
jgi:hypothetical protein